MPEDCAEWQLVHKPSVAVFQIAVPAVDADELRPLLWHETPLHVSSLPQVRLRVYVAMDAEPLVSTSAEPSPCG